LIYANVCAVLAVSAGDPHQAVVELESRLDLVALEIEEAEKARLRMERFGGRGKFAEMPSVESGEPWVPDLSNAGMFGHRENVEVARSAVEREGISLVSPGLGWQSCWVSG
jgi:hypothetical protein